MKELTVLKLHGNFLSVWVKRVTNLRINRFLVSETGLSYGNGCLVFKSLLGRECWVSVRWKTSSSG